MNIAVIAWGSLLWKPGPVKLASHWHPGGPPLPLEFARVSEDTPELALVLSEGAAPCPTYWAWLDTQNLQEARTMLREREKITPSRPDWIGTVPAIDGAGTDEGIAAWMRARRIDAVVWTALPPRFEGLDGRMPSAREALAWLGQRTGEDRLAAERYVRQTPAHVDTLYRRLIEARLGWHADADAHITCMR